MSRDDGIHRRDVLAAMGALGLFGVVGGLGWRQLELSDRLFNPVKLGEFRLPPVVGVEQDDGSPARGFSNADLVGGASLIVLFASWCPPCRREHRIISDLSQRAGIPVFGALYKDKPEAAAEFLRRKGNPFTAIGDDPRGLFARAMGVRGVPSTVLIQHGPRITLRLDGQIEDADISDKILPALTSA